MKSYLDSARACGLETDSDSVQTVAGYILEEDLPWRDWYNYSKNSITVLGAISYIKSKDQWKYLTFAEAAVVAYVEFHTRMPVRYFEDPQNDDMKLAGYDKPGWYFWSIEYTHVFGPYKTKKEAFETLYKYWKHEEGPKPVSQDQVVRIVASEIKNAKYDVVKALQETAMKER